MRINNNVTAMNAHRMYTNNNTSVTKSVSKLSSGYRINSSADDAAGLAISEKMRAQIRGLTMASKNSQDAVSLVQTAEGALQESHNILQRMRELAVQSGSDTNETTVDRNALNAEFQALKKEINDIATTTRFNDQNLLDGTFAKSTTSATSTFAEVSSAWASTNVAKNTYTVSISSVLIQSKVDAANATASTTAIAGLKDNTVCGIGNLTIDDYTAPTLETASSNGTWTFGYDADKAMFTMTNASTGETTYAKAEVIEASGTLELDFGKAGTIKLKNAGADDIQVSDLTGAANIGTIALSGGLDAAEEEYALVASVNGESINLEVGMDSLVFASTEISVKLAGTISFDSTTGDFAYADVEGETGTAETFEINVNKTQGKSLTIQSGANQGDELAINVDRMDANTLGIATADVGNRLNASAAITQVNSALNLVSTQRAELGALQNRLEYKIANLDTSSENLTAAESRIRDVDMAKEMTNFTKNNILAQASTAMLAQANALPQGVLQLLG